MVQSFQQFFNHDEEPQGSSNILFGRANKEKEFTLVKPIGNYEIGHIFTISESEHSNTKLIEVGTGISGVTVLDEYNEPVSFVGSSSKINLLFDEAVPIKDNVAREEVPPIIIREEIMGTQGQQGTQGVHGQQGSDGRDGLHGIPGDDGKDGKDGEQGIQGDQGIQGEVGPQGEQGIQSEQGIQGEVGPQGEQGIQGLYGDKGEQALEGKQGKQGIKGIQGVKGDKGVQGIQGKNGKQGLKGEKGIQGKDGTRGERGIHGKQGMPGLKGNDGREGKDGVDGKDGQEGFMDVQFPLKYDNKKKRISVDTKVLQKMLAVSPTQTQILKNIDWVGLAGGGAVGIRDNSSMVIKSVSDLNFKGSGVTVERKGKDVNLTFTDTGTFTESSSTPSSPSNGDRWHDTSSGKLYTYVTSESAWIEF